MPGPCVPGACVPGASVAGIPGACVPGAGVPGAGWLLSSRRLSRSSASAFPLRMPRDMNGAISLSRPPGVGVITSFTCVAEPSSESSHEPAGSDG